MVCGKYHASFLRYLGFVRRKVAYQVFAITILFGAITLLTHMTSYETPVNNCLNLQEYTYNVDCWSCKDKPHINRTWLGIRQNLSSIRSRKRKVIIFTYARGGSTVFGSLMNLDPMNILYWYEPLDPYMMAHYGMKPLTIPSHFLYERKKLIPIRKRFSQQEVTAMNQYFLKLLTCENFQSLPVEHFVHQFTGNSKAMKSIWRCVKSYGAISKLRRCEYNIPVICGGKRTQTRITPYSVQKRCFEMISNLLNDSDGRLCTFKETRTKDELSINLGPKDLTKTLSEKGGIINGHSSNISYSAQNSNNDLLSTKIEKFCHRHQCLRSLKDTIKPCIVAGQEVCEKSQMIAMKAIRPALSDLEYIIQQLPDLHIIFYTRDPRAMVNSRTELPSMTFLETELAGRNLASKVESQLLCERMSYDLRAKQFLSNKYPNLFIDIRYEDFISHPLETVQKMFDALNYTVPKAFYEWQTSTMNSTHTRDRRYGISRTNPLERLNMWRKMYNHNEIQMLTNNCLEVLENLNYKS